MHDHEGLHSIGRHGNGEIMPSLLAQLHPEEQIGVISGDGACDTRGVYEASAARGAALVVLPRRNGKPWKVHTTGAVERNESLTCHQALRTPPLETLERLSPAQLGRDGDVPSQAPGRAAVSP